MDTKSRKKKVSDSSQEDFVLEFEDNEKIVEHNKEENESEDEKVDKEEEKSSDSDEDDHIEVTYKSINIYKPTPEERKRLNSMKIQLRHTPPPQHTIEKTAGTRALKRVEKEQFEKYITLRTGTFSKKEDKIINDNWEAFCELHDWDVHHPKPFLFMKHKSKEFLLGLKNRIKFVQFLADGLNDRSLYSVYHRFRVLYDPHKTTRYKPDEDEVIVNYVKNYDSDLPDRKFADLAVMLKRTRASVWRRYRVLKKKKLL